MTKQGKWLCAALLAAAAVLLVALIVLAGKYQAAQRVNVYGTFCTDPSSQWNAQFLALDQAGNYANYTSGGTVISEGTHTVSGRIIALAGETGALSAVYADDTIYLFDAAGSDVTAYFRISDTAVYTYAN